MKETIYTTWAKQRNHWVEEMLGGWRSSGKSYLCFPWILFNVHTLPKKSFWMYLYYAQSRTNAPLLKGKIEFRVRVTSWRSDSAFTGDDIYSVRIDEVGKVWFLCNRYEEIVKENGELLSLTDFQHVNGKNLISTIRNSIPQVILQSNIKTIQYYP